MWKPSQKKTLHIAGTKGKGSTCCMTESILRSNNYSTGLFTSPHLVCIRERIKINGIPISEELWAHYFWICYEAVGTTEPRPGYFKFLTVMALKVFQEENVDAIILEVGIGGRIDTTNCLPSAVVTAITTLDYDHTELLGETLALIAFEKAGIMKPGVPMIIAPQEPEAVEVIKKRAHDVRAPLYFCSPFSEYTSLTPQPIILSLQGEYQKINSVLAIATAHLRLQQKGSSASPETFLENPKAFPTFALPAAYLDGLSHSFWPGRAQTLRLEKQPNVTYYLDGAHTIVSVKVCLEWFGSVYSTLEKKSRAVLCFNCKEEKDKHSMLQLLSDFHNSGIVSFDYVFFPASTLHSGTPNNSTNAFQHTLKQQWIETSGGDPEKCLVFPSISACLDKIKELANNDLDQPLSVLITGSLYLVGGHLELLGYNTIENA